MRKRATASRTEPAALRWLSFTSTPSSRPNLWFWPPPDTTALFSSAANARSRLARIENRDARSSDGIDVAPRQRCDAGESAEQIERHPLAREDRAKRSAHTGHRTRELEHLTFFDQPLELDPGIECPEDGFRRLEAGHDSGRACDEVRRSHRVAVDGRVRRYVSAPDVLRERGLYEALECAGRYSHVSNSGIAPGRSTT